MPPTPFAVIAGVGSGTGAALAHKFASAYPTALLARKPESYEPLVTELTKSGHKVIGISTDVADRASVVAAFEKIEKEFGTGDAGCAAAVFNASGPFARKSVLELTGEELAQSWDVSVKGALFFTQSVIPLMLKISGENQGAGQYPPTLIYTGATASMKSNARMSAFSTSKHAERALSLSVAREFAPKGVHIAHAIIDGAIDIPRTREWLKDKGPDEKISPESIADAYWSLHMQSRRGFTNEIDIRPMEEKW